jgi:hypothetical protein
VRIGSRADPREFLQTGWTCMRSRHRVILRNSLKCVASKVDITPDPSFAQAPGGDPAINPNRERHLVYASDHDLGGSKSCPSLCAVLH